nr:hypothetical protein BaRGS_010738 [Batillaria attramentaria]
MRNFLGSDHFAQHDFEKAFDSVDREALWKLLRHYGVPWKIISLIRCTYQDMSCRIAHAGQLSESFEVKTGVRQGCLLSPFLFLLVINWIMKTTTAGRKNGIQWTLWMKLDDLDFADDLALLSHSHSQMQDKTTYLEATSAGTGLKINRKKTELMKINTTANTPVTVGGEPIREVESFVYLGSVVDGQGGTDRDITARIGKARAAMVMLKNVWASKVVSIRTKLRIFNSNVKSVLLYGCETWRTTKAMQQKIQTFLNTCLRRIFNIRWPEKIRNEELWERAEQEPVAKQILRRKWGWIEHTLRKPASSTTRQALTWNPQGKRKRGRPRNSWRRDTEAELYKQGTNWTGVARIAQNRVRWRRVVDGLCSTWSQGPKSPDVESYYRQQYFEAIDTVSGASEDRFHKKNFLVARQIEQVLTSGKGLDDTDIPSTYAADLNIKNLKVQLQVLLGALPADKTVTVESVVNVLRQSVNMQSMLSEVTKLVKLYLTIDGGVGAPAPTTYSLEVSSL